MKEIIMYNPVSDVKIRVAHHMKSRWEKFGFIEIPDIKRISITKYRINKALACAV